VLAPKIFRGTESSEKRRPPQGFAEESKNGDGGILPGESRQITKRAPPSQEKSNPKTQPYKTLGRDTRTLLEREARVTRPVERGLLTSPEKRDVNVSAQSRVIGEVKPVVVGVLINHDLIPVPVPVIGEAVIVIDDAEIVAAKPETFSGPALNAENMAAAKAAVEPSMFPRMIHVVVLIIAARVMPNPLIIRVNVGCVRVPRLVAEAAVFLGPVLRSAILRSTVLRSAVFRSTLLDPGGSGTTSRNVPAANITMFVTTLIVILLRNGNDRNQQQY
jgi:hypothetical protein